MLLLVLVNCYYLERCKEENCWLIILLALCSCKERKVVILSSVFRVLKPCSLILWFANNTVTTKQTKKCEKLNVQIKLDTLQYQRLWSFVLNFAGGKSALMVI